MADLEKVKTGLECCAIGAECDHCPYSQMNDGKGDYTGCHQLHWDAIELLKILDSALKFLADSGFDTPCDENMCDDGWCEEHCSMHGQTKDCWLRYFSKITKDGEQE